MLMPALLGYGFIAFDVISAGGLRSVIFDLAWLFFAFTLVAASILSKAPVIEEAKRLSRVYMTIFVLFVCVWAYTTIVVAPSSRMANYYSGIGIAAILVGLASAALKRRFGNQVVISISWALFIAMLLHAPSWMWLYMIEGENPAFDWKYHLPGIPGLRMYSYSIEVGIAAGLGLYFLTTPRELPRRLVLFFGTTILWMLLFWSGGRGGLFALLASIAVVALIVPGFSSKMWRFIVTSIVTGAGLSLLLPVPSVDYGLLGRVSKSVNSNTIDGMSNTLNGISTGRLTVWSDAYHIFLEKPVFGQGVAQYRHITERADLVKLEQVHNILLESLISFGLVGTVFLIFLLGRIWVSAAFRFRGAHSLATVPMFLVATSLLVHGLVSGTYYHIHSVIMIAISLGFLLNTQE